MPAPTAAVEAGEQPGVVLDLPLIHLPRHNPPMALPYGVEQGHLAAKIRFRDYTSGFRKAVEDA